MGTTPNPVQNQEGLKFKNPTSKLSDLLTSAHGALSQVRDKYADMVNNLADSITAHANLTPEAEPIKKDLGTTVRAGMGMFGVPVPPRGAGQDSNKGSAEEPLESTLPGKPGSEESSVKVPKGQMKPAKIMSAIEDAASKSQSLHMTYQNPEWDEPKQYLARPYSYRGEGNQTLMAYDELGKGIRAFKLDNIINATPSGKTFKPKWEIEIGQKPQVSDRPTPEEDFQRELRESENKPVPKTGPMYPGTK